MIIIGIDTAIRKTGYGVIDMRTGGSIQILDCGLIRNAPSLPHSECLRRLAGGIRELVSSFKPEAAAIESAFVSRNVRTAMILSLARGAVITALAECSEAKLTRKPENTVGINDLSKAQQVLRLVERLEELDDVQAVYSNENIASEVLDEIDAQG